MKQIQFIGLEPEALIDLIDEKLNNRLEDFKKHWQPKEPNCYMTRQEVAEMLSIDLSTLWNWQNRKILHPKQIGGRVLFLRSDIEKAIVELKK